HPAGGSRADVPSSPVASGSSGFLAPVTTSTKDRREPTAGPRPSGRTERKDHRTGRGARGDREEPEGSTDRPTGADGPTGLRSAGVGVGGGRSPSWHTRSPSEHGNSVR